MQEAELQMSNMRQNAQLENQRQETLLQAQLTKRSAKRKADLKRYSGYLLDTLVAEGKCWGGRMGDKSSSHIIESRHSLIVVPVTI
jgi:hypothetical protein